MRNNTLQRRQFLVTTTAACAGAWWGRRALAADEPQVAAGAWQPRLSLAAYSFHRYLPRGWPKPQDGEPTMSLYDFIDFAASQKLDAVELTSYYFPNPLSREYLASIREHCATAGLAISGTAIGNDFCLPEGSGRDFELEMTRQWIDYAAALGAPLIRIFAGKVPEGDTESDALDRCVAGIQQSLEYAAEKQVILALENHGGITATPEQLLDIVRRVGESPWFGVNFDSGNFQTADPYGDLAKIAPYAVNAQIKVAISPNGQKEPADLPRIVVILRDANYRGDVVLEYEESEEPREAIPRYLATLRELL